MANIEDRDTAVDGLKDVMWKFTSYIGKRLPTDVTNKLADLCEKETHPLAKAVYQPMKDNQEAADKLDRPSCQDTGVIQYFINAGARFPLLGDLEKILNHATLKATRKGPLRHNAVETFDEKNTGTNTGSKIPWLDWEIDPQGDSATIDVYMAGRRARDMPRAPSGALLLWSDVTDRRSLVVSLESQECRPMAGVALGPSEPRPGI